MCLKEIDREKRVGIALRAVWLVTMLLLLSSACSVGRYEPGKPYVAETKLTHANAATILTDHSGGIYIRRIDASLGPHVVCGQMTIPALLLNPGVHLFVVYYDNGQSHSIARAEVTAPREPAQRYSV